MTEELGYRVLQRYPDFEVREYPAHSLIECELSGEFSAVGNQAFGTLLGYISGANRANRRIAMTAPVLQRELPGGRHAVSFVLPAALTGQAPDPLHPALRSVTVGAECMAVRRFSGGWTRARAASQEASLRLSLERVGLEAAGPARFARFDPPWKPGFLRRNEVLIPLRKK